ncbi:transporter [uncultured Nitrospira sp.]|uniref:transporter n=1 Tax=uncultured Nitrospira sp. TaxID=157176 RepID=UPI0031402FFB
MLLGQSWCFSQETSDAVPTPRPWIIGHAAPFSQPIFTDRPTFSVGPGTIAPGHIQFETGYTFSYEDAHPDGHTHTFPETLLRIGLMENFELRVEWPNLTYIDNGTNVDGFRDLGVGFKVQVFQQQGFRPRLSFAGRLSIPTGNDAFSSDQLDPELRTILTYELNERVGLFGNVNIAGPSSHGTRFVQVSSSLGLSAALRDHLTGFVEYFGLYPRDVASGSANFLQTGVIYGLTYNLQVDARIGGGLTHGSDDLLTGAGISWRF